MNNNIIKKTTFVNTKIFAKNFFELTVLTNKLILIITNIETFAKSFFNINKSFVFEKLITKNFVKNKFTLNNVTTKNFYNETTAKNFCKKKRLIIELR